MTMTEPEVLPTTPRRKLKLDEIITSLVNVVYAFDKNVPLDLEQPDRLKVERPELSPNEVAFYSQQFGSDFGKLILEGPDSLTEAEKVALLRQILPVAMDKLRRSQKPLTPEQQENVNNLLAAANEYITDYNQREMAVAQANHTAAMQTLTEANAYFGEATSALDESQTTLTKAGEAFVQKLEAEYETARTENDEAKKRFTDSTALYDAQVNEVAKFAELYKKFRFSHDKTETILETLSEDQKNTLRNIGALSESDDLDISLIIAGEQEAQTVLDNLNLNVKTAQTFQEDKQTVLSYREDALNTGRDFADNLIKQTQGQPNANGTILTSAEARDPFIHFNYPDEPAQPLGANFLNQHTQVTNDQRAVNKAASDSAAAQATAEHTGALLQAWTNNAKAYNVYSGQVPPLPGAQGQQQHQAQPPQAQPRVQHQAAPTA